MQDSSHSNGIFSAGADYDAVIVGASLAGCATAIQLGRAGARVALVEKHADPQAFKRICSHFIQASAVPAIERLGLLEPMLDAGALRSHIRIWTKWGWIAAPRDPQGTCINLRREKLDPLIRGMAAETPGVELLLGRTAQALVRDGEVVRGVVVRARDGQETTLRGGLVIGADGRDSKIAELSGVPEKRVAHGRFAYGAYFRGAAPAQAPDTPLWMTDPQWAAAFPTDDGLTFYAAMPTKWRLPEFRRDPLGALVSFVADQPEPPPIRDGELVGQVMGKMDMENRVRRPVAPGLALVGDAALAIDPLWGVGCGFAFQTAEWLAESVTPALLGAEPLDDALERYRKRHARGLRGHTQVMLDYASGRRFNPGERMTFSAAAIDPGVARLTELFGTRQIGPLEALVRTVPRAVAVHARTALRQRPAAAPAEPEPQREREAVAA
jgi:2-polyprenyl-6-methoxyphenol hydroxylase-like FAD-dependent oxidoreductase